MFGGKQIRPRAHLGRPDQIRPALPSQAVMEERPHCLRWRLAEQSGVLIILAWCCVARLQIGISVLMLLLLERRLVAPLQNDIEHKPERPIRYGRSDIEPSTPCR